MTDPSEGSSGDVPPAGPWSATDAAEFILGRLRAQSEDQWRPDELGPRPGNSAVPSVSGLKVRASFARSVDTYSDVLRQVFGSFAAEMAALLSAPPVGADLPAPVTIVGRPGSVAGAVVWIHNISGGVVPGFALTMTDVSSAGGARVGAARFSADPASFESSSELRRASWVSLLVPGSTVPGIYYGHLLAKGLPDAAVPVRLVVQ